MKSVANELKSWSVTVEEIIKIVVFTLVTLATLAVIIKWGIEKYFQKNEEVIRLKEQITNHAIQSIEKTMEKVGQDLVNVSKNMDELEGHLVIFQSRLNDYDSKNNEILRSYIGLTAEVRKKLEILDKLEIYEDKGHIIIKKKH